MPSSKNKGKGKKMKQDLDKKRGAQAALDYLVSWGWVLIVIVLVLVILFSLGIFKVPSAPTIITGFQGITMQAAQANNSMMVIEITNDYNQFVNITGITVNVNGNTYTSDSCLDNIISNGQSTLCRIPISIPTSSYLSKIQISFTPYKSTTYEVSNGTVSSTLLSGSIPINNQLTYFIEKGLPYGSTFTVNYNTSTNSTVVSSSKDNVSFNLPFGKYYFTVPSVSYQGCVSAPSPSSGYHSTGASEVIAFISNCTTTFSESGLPSGQVWQLTFNGTIKTASTGSTITFKSNDTANAYVSYIATAKSDSLYCISSYDPSISLGSSYTFSAWNCTTTFSETGLPSGQGWTTNYDNSANKGSTNSLITFSNNEVTSVSESYAFSNSNQLSCVTGSVLLYMGSSYTFNKWNCGTSFSESGLPSGQNWQVEYNNTLSSESSTSSAITFEAYNLTNVAVSYTASSLSDNLNCKGSSTPSTAVGSSYTFSAWNCTTTFSETGLPSDYTWTVDYNSTTNSVSSPSNIVFLNTFSSSIASPYSYSVNTLTNSSSSPSCITTYTPSPSSGSTLAGNSTTISFSASTKCKVITTFTESGLPKSTAWNVTYDGITNSSNSNVITFDTYSGSYSYSIPGNSSSAPNTIISKINSGFPSSTSLSQDAYDSANGDIYVANSGSNSVSVISSSSNSVISTISVGSGPDAIAYDSANGDIYVANSGSNSVSVISSSSNSVIATVTYRIGSGPISILYDSANGDIYVVSYGSGVVGIINQDNNVIGNITVGSYPDGIAYDSENGNIYVANSGSNSVDVINNVNSVIKTVNVGSYPDGIAYDSENGNIYVVNSGSNSVSIINSSSNSVIATVSVGSDPDSIAYDSANGNIYVDNELTSSVSVISSSSNSVIATVSNIGSDPAGIAYDSANGEIYATTTSQVTVISSVKSLFAPSTTSGSLSAGSTVSVNYKPYFYIIKTFDSSNYPIGPFSMGYDYANGYMYYTNDVGDSRTVSPSLQITAELESLSYSDPVGIAYDSANGYLASCSSSTSSTGNLYAVILSSPNYASVETDNNVGAYPAGIAYDSANGYLYVADSGATTVNDISPSNSVSSINVETYPNGVAYDKSNGDIYITDGDYLSVISPSNGVNNIDIGHAMLGVAYDSENGDIYVTNYNENSVSVIDSSSNSVIATISVGSYPYAIAYDSENGDIYVTNYKSNSVSIINSSSNSVIATISLSGGPDSIAYDAANGYMFVGYNDYVSVLS
jgi:YVTN family beta-propeller protein